MKSWRLVHADSAYCMREFTAPVLHNIDIVNYCRAVFNFELPGTVIEQRTSQFRDKYRSCDNLYCKLLCVR